MIFKTFDNDIDKWTAKIGVFGKSFNELGTAVNKSFESVIVNFDEGVGFGKSLKNNLFPKKDLESQLIDVDTLFSGIDSSNTTEVTEKIKKMSSDVAEGKTTWQKLYDTLPEGEKLYAKLGKEMNDQIITEEGIVQANQEARKAALAHNAALKQQTLGAKAASAGMKALSIAGNLVAGIAVAKGIEWIATSISNYVNSSNIAKEKTEALSSSLSEAQSKYAEDSKKIGELSSRYETLSKGVNHLGQNVSLSSSQYDEYKSVIQQ